MDPDNRGLSPSLSPVKHTIGLSSDFIVQNISKDKSSSPSDSYPPKNIFAYGIQSPLPTAGSGTNFSHIDSHRRVAAMSTLSPGEEPSSPVSPHSDAQEPKSSDNFTSKLDPTPQILPNDIESFTVPPYLLHLTATEIQEMPDATRRAKLVEASELLRQATTCIQTFDKVVSRMRLQSQLLTIETHEAAQRFEVEKMLVQREVDRLRYEQIDHQKYMAAAAGTKSNSETYRRRLQKAKLKLKDAAKEIETRDKDIIRIKKMLREGRVLREALETALAKSNAQREDLQQQSTPLLRNNLSSSLDMYSIPSTPPQPPAPVTPTKRSSDALGILAFNPLPNPPRRSSNSTELDNNTTTNSSPKSRSVPPVSADFPQFPSNNTPSRSVFNLPPLRLPDDYQTRTPPDSSNTTGLLSPLAFKGLHSSVSSSFTNQSPTSLGPPLFPLSQEPQCRESSATFTIPSDDSSYRNSKDSDENDEYLGGSDRKEFFHNQHTQLAYPPFPDSPQSPHKQIQMRGHHRNNTASNTILNQPNSNFNSHNGRPRSSTDTGDLSSFSISGTFKLDSSPHTSPSR